MSVLIKGMGFPTKENFMTQLYLICDKDGDWYAVDTTNKDLYKLIEVKEPHGRLKDVDRIKYENVYFEDVGESYEMVGKDDIDELPTIIEAEGSKTDA